MSGAIWDIPVTKDTGGPPEYEICPADNYTAVIIGLIDVGNHQKENKDGEIYLARQLVLVVETVLAMRKGGRFVFPRLYTWSMRDNSNFYKMVATLTGKKYPDGTRFDPSTILGLPCMAMISNTEGTTKKGKPAVFANLESLAKFPAGLPVPVASRPPLLWSIREKTPRPDMSFIPAIYGKTVEVLIRESEEYKAGQVAESTFASRPRDPAAEESAKRVAHNAGIQFTDDDDDRSVEGAGY